ncbi:MAG: HupE/UreJ family protein [Vicinamibacterales bacterium]
MRGSAFRSTPKVNLRRPSARRCSSPASHLLVSLLSFNVGVEIGQVLVLMVLVPALGALFRFVMRERVGTIVLSALVGHVAWHWMADRWTALRQFPAPELDAVALVWAVRGLLLIVSIAAGMWLAGRRRARATGPVTPQG